MGKYDKNNIHDWVVKKLPKNPVILKQEYMMVVILLGLQLSFQKVKYMDLNHLMNLLTWHIIG